MTPKGPLSSMSLAKIAASSGNFSNINIVMNMHQAFNGHWPLLRALRNYLIFSSVQLLSRVRLFATPWIAARQASLSITTSRSSFRLMSIESVTPSSHPILGRPLLLLPPISPSIRVFSNESTLCMRCPKYWSFSFSIIPSKEIIPSKGDQSWIFIGRTDVKAETPILWPPDAKNWLIRKDPDVGKDWSHEEKGMTGWDGWMASTTQWAWGWVDSGSWWGTGQPGVLQSKGSQRVRHNWVTTELNR